MTKLFLIMGAVIFGCGVYGFLTRRNLILMFLALELMLFGVSLNFVAFGNLHGDLGGQTFAILILTVAACEAALALSLIVTLYRSRGTLDINLWQSLREPGASDEPYQVAVPEPAPNSDDPSENSYGDLPKLTPAGLDPLKDPAEVTIKQREPVGSA